ncbi:MAG: CDP-alcohol phosphatidyltransferase family protein [Methanomassiliicoccales archaeon]|nr:MAG: CDP-alcohol phosphatidyltransferase family protein [Methanomassiliicoccales archaeon]
MVLDAKRDKAERFLMPAAKALRKVDPNVISLMALILAFLTGISAYYSYEHWRLLLPSTSVLVITSGYLDAVDGKVARISGKANKRGDFIDHVFDRYADIFMIGGVALSGWCDIHLGILALLGVLMTSYMGTQAQALGIGRMYGGLLGRADRIVLMFFVPMLQLSFTAITGDMTFSLLGSEISIFELMMAWFAVIGNITAVQRALYTWRALGGR